MPIDDLITQLKTVNEENPLPQDFADKLETEYLRDLDIRDTAVRELQTKLTDETAERDKEITRLKLENYGYISKLPNNITTPPPATGNDADDEIPDSIESLAANWKY